MFTQLFCSLFFEKEIIGVWMAASRGSDELRVFYQRSQGVGTIWSLLGKPRGREKRTDTYLHLTSSVGLKWRSQNRLEVKLRTAHDPATGVERWTKRGLGDTPLPTFSNDREVIDAVEKNLTDLRPLLHESEQQSLDCALARLSAMKMTEEGLKSCVFKLAKKRRSSGISGVAIEQARIKVTVAGRPDLAIPEFRSIAIEGGSSDILIAHLDKLVFERLGVSRETVQIAGYPAFLGWLTTTYL